MVTLLLTVACKSNDSDRELPAASVPVTRSASVSAAPAVSASAAPKASPEKVQALPPPPRIGVNGGYRTTDVSETLAFIIRSHGGEPVRLLATKPRDTLKGKDVQGLILVGGMDINPTAYGEATVHESVNITTPARQVHDFALYREAKAAGIPVLGYGLGAQEIWVLEGGKLHQDMVADGQPDHKMVQHELQIERPLQGFLAGEQRVIVKCNHHQGFKLPVPPTLQVVAWAPAVPEIGANERVPEAIMTKQQGWFCVGTQFLLGRNQYSEDLVVSLIDAAKARQARK